MRNGHLNLFRAYSGGEHLENNLTRALALCLEKDALFLRLFLQHDKVLGNQTSELFAHLQPEESNFVVDIQRDVKSLPGSEKGITRVIGLTLTTNADNADFTVETGEKVNKQITDVVLQIQDVLIVIEAKTHGGDASSQLKAQLQFLQKEKLAIKYESLSWEQVLGLVQNAQHNYQLLGQPAWLLDAFHQLIEQNYAHWLPTKPFKFIEFYQNLAQKQINHIELNKRLAVVKQHLEGYELEEIANRVAIKIDWKWASEVLMWFRESDSKLELGVFVWPANTKQQGYYLYQNEKEGWNKKHALQVNGYSFRLRIYPQVKFSNSFGKFEYELEFDNPDKELRQPIHTLHNFQKKSGQWSQKKSGRTFADLENFLDEHINRDKFDWRDKVKWEEKYKNNPNRTSLSISFGYTAMVTIPYEQLQALDRTDADKTDVARLLKEVVDALENLIY